ncbi:hypothetical protein mRhiFer1_008015 [Rhinolophus ferrumequinum]|uniref:Uncharacterized protein n=1 Tax=Rhinolophus ferrumequinum TaxID=59479 RepID=A0A7J7WR66_RHIFE|nr:hypothetical protein mRhiFer1_008015 [Rhinolophus ferrumequinum]
MHLSFTHSINSLYGKGHGSQVLPLCASVHEAPGPLLDVTQNSRTAGLQASGNSWSHCLILQMRWSVTTEGQGRTANRSPILGPQFRVSGSQRHCERKPRPPEAGLWRETSSQPQGLKINVPAPAVHCPCSHSYALGISTGISH